MALEATDETHARQILAGTTGREKGHKFEASLSEEINLLGNKSFKVKATHQHVTIGVPSEIAVNYIAAKEGFNEVTKIEAWWLGGIATGAGGSKNLGDTGLEINRSKSDVVVRISGDAGVKIIGIGIKTCNKATATNAQLYFSTATAFCDLLEDRVCNVPANSREALRSFCGDTGFTPKDMKLSTSASDRFYWEELPAIPRAWWEELFSSKQREISELLLRFAYRDDPIAPSYLLHQRMKPHLPTSVPIAIYSMDEFLDLNYSAGLFSTKKYRVLKGSNRNPDVWHEAPRFGYIQFQRGGQKQHPTQLQFNLKAGYFNDHY